MAKPKIKRITRDNEVVEPEHEDQCVYHITYNEEMTQVMLSISAGRSMTPEEYIMALVAFINDVENNADDLFVEDAYPDNDLH
jgi:hypothetical protein